MLGLDISTSCTGWCVIGPDGKLIKMGYISLKNDKSPFKKAKKVRQVLGSINIDYDIEHICIEENLQAFRPGLSSAKTLLTLARFNGVISYLAQEEFCISPVFINVNSARKSLGIKIKRKKDGGSPTKDQVFDWVRSQVSENYPWPTKVLKSGPRKGKKIHEPYCFDMADAYVIARSGLII
jgi:Holliday junction resolvasome RuvABC endonuclease subunit